MVVVGVILLAVLALVVGGPRVFETVLPARALAWLDSAGTGGWDGMLTGAEDAPDTGDALALLRDSSDGWKPDGKIAALPGGGAAFVTQVLAGQVTRLDGAKPADVVALAEVEGCAFTPPTAAAAVGHARIDGDTGLDLGLATYGDTDLAHAVQVLVNVYRSRGVAPKSSLSGLRYQAYDIAVTETEKPVYLVLETGPQSRIFNIHLAPGARLERVVLIGGDQVGVANLPGDVPVEAMRAEKAAACGFQPFYRLNPGHLFYQSLAMGAIRADEAQEKERHFAQLAMDWEARFRQSFGVGAAESLSGGWVGGTVAAVGPLPATGAGRAVYAPIEGALLRCTVERYVEFEGQAPEQGFDARVKAIATAFAWGDLKNLAQGVAY